LDLCWV